MELNNQFSDLAPVEKVFVLQAGANGIITGGYLTTGGNRHNKDIEMIKEIGLKV